MELANELLLEILQYYSPSTLEELSEMLQQRAVSRFWNEALNKLLSRPLSILLMDGFLELRELEENCRTKIYSKLEENCKELLTLPKLLESLHLDSETWKVYLTREEHRSMLLLEHTDPERSLMTFPSQEQPWAVSLAHPKFPHKQTSVLFRREHVSGWKSSELLKLAPRLPGLLAFLPNPRGELLLSLLLRLGLETRLFLPCWRFGWLSGGVKLLMLENRENFALCEGIFPRYLFLLQPGGREKIYWVDNIVFYHSLHTLNVHRVRDSSQLLRIREKFELAVEELGKQNLSSFSPPYYSGYYLEGKEKPFRKQFLMERIC